jgi:cysteine-rich repeat protein
MRFSVLALCALGCGESISLTCGDAIVDRFESCDDGNRINADGCSRCLLDGDPAFADEVVEAPGASGEGFGDPENAVNGVRGGGARMQSLDVYEIPLDGYLVLSFGGRVVVDGPGDDLVLFENAFVYGDEERTFIDPAIVEVSLDGEAWVTLTHDYVAEDEAVYSSRREDWIGFGGVTPVLLNADENPIDPFDDGAGGDRFDLAGHDARYVRIVPAPSRTNPDTGQAFPQDVIGDGPDIDGLFARYLAEEP